MNTKTPLTPAQLDRRHQFQVTAGALAYLVVLLVSIHFLKQPGMSLVASALLGVSPMVPAVFVIWSVFQHITRMDELQRRIQTEALALSAAGTALLGLTYTFLEGDAGFPHLGAWWAWVSVGLIWAVARTVLRRRYQ
ncbi:MAG: hypothetical protein ACRESC_00590 [Gammaproteobacteria bacterium]